MVDNDANAAAWAEWRFGAARGERTSSWSPSAPASAARILVGRTACSAAGYGIAGEFGHMQVVPGGHRCECGNRGCWEQYASGNALVREARAMVDADSPVAQRPARRASVATPAT